MKNILQQFRYCLKHPLTRGLNVDDQCTTELRIRIIKEKKFLCKIYQEWYKIITDSLPKSKGPVLELGSGGGFLKEVLPNVITSDVFKSSKVDVVLNGSFLPFADCTLKGIVMTNVLHHIPDSQGFFAEANRCLMPGGIVIMIEPWVNTYSAFIYKHLHEEPFMPEAPAWDFTYSGPLSGANGALPWIIFKRDREKFENMFPSIKIELIKPIMPFCYFISGGVSLRSIMPGCTFRICRAIESFLVPWADRLSMFAVITLRRRAC